VRVFLDTHVLIAAFAARGLCADVFRLATTDYTVLIGAPVVIDSAGSTGKRSGRPWAKPYSMSRYSLRTQSSRRHSPRDDGAAQAAALHRTISCDASSKVGGRLSPSAAAARRLTTC